MIFEVVVNFERIPEDGENTITPAPMNVARAVIVIRVFLLNEFAFSIGFIGKNREIQIQIGEFVEIYFRILLIKNKKEIPKGYIYRKKPKET